MVKLPTVIKVNRKWNQGNGKINRNSEIRPYLEFAPRNPTLLLICLWEFQILKQTRNMVNYKILLFIRQDHSFSNLLLPSRCLVLARVVEDKLTIHWIVLHQGIFLPKTNLAHPSFMSKVRCNHVAVTAPGTQGQSLSLYLGLTEISTQILKRWPKFILRWWAFPSRLTAGGVPFSILPCIHIFTNSRFPSFHTPWGWTELVICFGQKDVGESDNVLLSSWAQASRGLAHFLVDPSPCHESKADWPAGGWGTRESSWKPAHLFQPGPSSNLPSDCRHGGGPAKISRLAKVSRTAQLNYGFRSKNMHLQ